MLLRQNPTTATKVTPEAVRAQLARILAHERFSRSERSRRFLAFLVESALEGKTVKEYVLAVEVFGRPASFTPDSDPIVRVETGKLRKKLQAYYEAAGKSDPVVIELPARTYTPVFRAVAASQEPEPGKTARWFSRRVLAVAAIAVVGLGLAAILTGTLGDSNANAGASRSVPVTLAVLPFVDLSPEGGRDSFSEGLTVELIEQLARVQGLSVVSGTSSLALKDRREDARKIATGYPLDSGDPYRLCPGPKRF